MPNQPKLSAGKFSTTRLAENKGSNTAEHRKQEQHTSATQNKTVRSALGEKRCSKQLIDAGHAFCRSNEGAWQGHTKGSPLPLTPLSLHSVKHFTQKQYSKRSQAAKKCCE